MKRLLIAVALALLLVAGLAGGVTFVGHTRIHESFKGYADEGVFVDISPGLGSAAIGRQLVDAAVVRDPVTFRAAVWLSGRARDLRAGEYRFDRPMSALEVVEKISRGDVYRRLVTFPEGLTIREMARVYEAAGLGTAAQFEQAAIDVTAIAALDAEARTLEGYLFPETYALGRKAPAAVLIAQMTELFMKTFSPEMIEAARAHGLSVRDAVTLASLVEKETALADERRIVAAVYLNRRRVGMPMQADPTVIYALQAAGRYDGNLRRDDLQIDSPYNTYRYPGLPPGPIAAPGRAALEAAVNPAPVDYLYFVSRNDGSHVFARTLAEHNRNVQRWQVEFFRRRARAKQP
ncbi:MAG: endolytic transglycosylase MltG [Acidobacteriota bacterium]